MRLRLLAVAFATLLTVAAGAVAASAALPPVRPSPRPGAVARSAVEGFDLELLAIEGDQAHVRVTLHPHALGPPMHAHEGFDEVFEVETGVLSIDLGGEIVTVQPGERLVIPRGRAHRPHNPTDQPVVLAGRDPTMPVDFFVDLAALYPCMDRAGTADAPHVLLQIAAMGVDVDTWLVGPPPAGQRLVRRVLSPIARAAGYGYGACSD